MSVGVTTNGAPRKMPKQKPGASKQDYGTPREFLDAVEKRFGKLDFDLAASWKNAVCDDFFGYQQSGVFVDSLTQDWRKLDGNLWLNPPFAKIAPWASKCAESAPWRSKPERCIFFLTPASVGANWFWKFVWSNALVLPLHPRLEFDGCPVNPKTGKIDPFPKDLMLSCFGVKPGFERWLWKGDADVD